MAEQQPHAPTQRPPDADSSNNLPDYLRSTDTRRPAYPQTFQYTHRLTFFYTFLSPNQRSITNPCFVVE